MTIAFKWDCPVHPHRILDIYLIAIDQEIKNFALAQIEVISEQYFYFCAEVSFLGFFCLIQGETVGARRVDNLINCLPKEGGHLD